MSLFFLVGYKISENYKKLFVFKLKIHRCAAILRNIQFSYLNNITLSYPWYTTKSFS
jgi:hypothetical protein